MRRVLFGLVTICRGEGVPQGVLAAIPEVGRQVVEITMRQVSGREETLDDNLKYLDGGCKDSDSDASDQSDEDVHGGSQGSGE